MRFEFGSGSFSWIGIILAATFLVAPAAHAQLSSVEGTWRLVARDLPDGTRVTPPQVMGMASLHKGQRNLNVLWYSAGGKPASYSLMSTYVLTNTTYTETVLFSIFNDPDNPQSPLYNLAGETKSMPATRDGRKVSFKLPFDLPSVEFDGDRLIATAPGKFVDHWEKVR